MNPLTPYMVWIKVGAALAICAACYLYGGSNATAKERAKWQAKENKALLAAVAERDRAQAERNAARRALDELAKHPPKVVEIVRTNPSGCVRPAPVADAVRVQVDAVNAAIRSMPGASDAPGK